MGGRHGISRARALSFTADRLARRNDPAQGATTESATGSRMLCHLGECPALPDSVPLCPIVLSTANGAIRSRYPLKLSTMATKTIRIPDLKEQEFTALFFLFNEGLSSNPEISRSPAVMGALYALQQPERVSVKLPGES